MSVKLAGLHVFWRKVTWSELDDNVISPAK